MSEKNLVELVSPDGKRRWTPASPSEATNLRARGWSEKPDDVKPLEALADELASVPSPPANKAVDSKIRK